MGGGVNREIVFSVVEKHASNYTEGRNFLVFSILGEGENKSHLVVVEEDGFYRELFIRNDSLISVQIREPNDTLKLAFCKDIYHTGFKDLVDFPEKVAHPAGNDVYFVFVDKNKNLYGESIASAFAPMINRDVHFYLLVRIARNTESMIPASRRSRR